MCNNNSTRVSNNNSIAEILRVILVLQQNANPESCLDTCDRPVLGGGNACLACNTRPVMLYLCCDGTPFTMPTSKDFDMACTTETAASCSSVFRVEKVDDNSATLRVLAINTDTTNLFPYVATNSFFTINLDCICAIRCLSDTFIECI